jgi:hypothetical protein
MLRIKRFKSTPVNGFEAATLRCYFQYKQVPAQTGSGTVIFTQEIACATAR